MDLVCERPVASFGEATSFQPHFGGAVANVAVAAARRGAAVSLAGGVGDDPWGHWLRDRLEAEGVDLEWFRLLSGEPTPVAFVTVDAAAEPSFVIYGETIAAAVTALRPRLAQAVEDCDALFLTTNTMVGELEREVTLDTHVRARELDRPVVFDPNLRPGRWSTPSTAVGLARDLVDGAFLVKCNRKEAELLSGERDPAAAAAGLLAGGARHVVVTLGADGALLRGEGGLRLDVPGVPARPRNATGAGDAVTGVLLAALGTSDFYAPAIAAALGDAVAEGARATERWGALG